MKGIAAAGVTVQAVEGGTWENFTTSNSPLNSNYISDIDLDQAGNVWMSTFGPGETGNGINVRHQNGTWQAYTTSNSGLQENRVYMLSIHDNGDNWFGTDTGGASVFYPNGTWFTYNSSNGLKSNWVLDIQREENGTLWFSNWYEGIAVRHPDNSWQYYNTGNSGLPNNMVYAILLTESGNKWFATYGGGVSVLRSNDTWQTYNTSNSGLTHNNVYTITKANDDTLWFGTLGGGVSILHTNGTWQSYTPTNSGLASLTVWSIVQDAVGNWWFGTDNGISVLKTDNSWMTFNLNNNDIRAIRFDKDNNLWLGTNGGGLYVFYAHTISGNAGVPRATLSFADGTPKVATADESGNYSFTVSYNWSGTVTPSLPGFVFTNTSRTYDKVLANQTEQNYTATPIIYTISGNAGVPGATLSYTDGSGKTATTDDSGDYSFTVSYDWSGTVTPSKTGHIFTPPSQTYNNLKSNQTEQDFSYTLETYLMSVSTIGTGSGSIVSSPEGISCGTTCFDAFTYNTEVTLTATAAAHSYFTGWSYDGCPGTGICTVVMDTAISITANFMHDPYLIFLPIITR